jgi:hypothetical protein
VNAIQVIIHVARFDSCRANSLEGIARSVVACRVVRADVRKGVALDRKFPARQLIVRAKNDAMRQLEQDQSNCASR